MSRVGKTPIPVDSRVKITVAGRDVAVEGPKGKMTYSLPDCVNLKQTEQTLVVECPRHERSRTAKTLYGTTRANLNNIVTGVTTGFRRELEIQGVGYRGQCSGRKLTLSLGFSHPVEFVCPEGIAVSMPDNTHIVLEGIDKQLVGQTAATIRGFRPPDAYKGKGIRYAGEEISLKEGKTVG
jgi:large subunit ribosomal protein L6